MYNYLHMSKSAEQPLQVPGDRALNQPKPHPSGKIKMLCDFQWQADKICSSETPDWKALEAANALRSWALT